MFMIRSCRTCAKSAPCLFFPTKHFICGQVILFVLTTIFFSFGFSGVLSYASTLKDSVRPGCREAVLALPKVPNDSEELIDPEDGQVLECPICAETFATEKV